MHNWPGGTRTYNTKNDGLVEQWIRLSPENRAIWEKILAAANPLTVQWTNDMTLCINGHPIVMQSTDEREGWHKTFPPGCFTTHEAYANFVNANGKDTLFLGCRPRAGAATVVKTPDESPVDLATLTPAKLRTKAAELGMVVKVTEAKALLIERIKARLAETPVGAGA